MSKGVPAGYAIDVEWEGEMRYRGGPEGGPALVMDGARQSAPSPVDSLLISLAACSAIDVVEILNKRRTPPSDLRVSVEFSRAAEPPRRLTEVRLRYRVATDSARSHVERAIALSFEKYCSVAATFARDIPLEWELELRSAEPSGEAA